MLVWNFFFGKCVYFFIIFGEIILYFISYLSDKVRIIECFRDVLRVNIFRENYCCYSLEKNMYCKKGVVKFWYEVRCFKKWGCNGICVCGGK